MKSIYDIMQFLRDHKLPLVGAEIGVAFGGSGISLLNDGLSLLYSIDSWRHLGVAGDGSQTDEWHLHNFIETIKNLTPFESRSIIIRGKSEDVCHLITENSLGVLLIDGDHNYKAVKIDLENYYSKVLLGGLVCLHDYGNEGYGVTKAATEFCSIKGHEIMSLEHGWAYFIKS